MIRLFFAFAALCLGVLALACPLIEKSQSEVFQQWQDALSPAAFQMPAGLPPLGTAPPSAYPPGTMFPPGTLFPPQSYAEAARQNRGEPRRIPFERNRGEVGQEMPPELHPPYSYLPGVLFPAGTFPPGTTFNSFDGTASPPRADGRGDWLWNYSPVAFGLCALALGFLGFCLALSDRFFRGAASLAALIFAGTAIFVALAVLRNHTTWNSALPLRVGFAFLLLSALCAGVAALRREESPDIDEISQNWSERRQQAASQPPRPGILTHRLTTPAARTTLIVIAVTSLLGACVTPVLKGHDPYGYINSPTIYSVSLLDYAPIFPLIMLAPLAAMIYGITVGRNDIRQVGAGLGTLLTCGLSFQLWRDMRDRANDYAYGILATPSYRHFDNLAIGFWLLGLAGLCWFALNFDDPEALNRTAHPGAKQRVAPVDFGDIALQGFAALLTFGFCLSVFPLGIFLWRYFDEQDNRLAPVALCGWVLGLVFWLGRFLLVGARAFS